MEGDSDADGLTLSLGLSDADGETLGLDGGSGIANGFLNRGLLSCKNDMAYRTVSVVDMPSPTFIDM